MSPVLALSGGAGMSAGAVAMRGKPDMAADTAKSTLLTDAVEKRFRRSLQARLIQDQLGMHNIDSRDRFA